LTPLPPTSTLFPYTTLFRSLYLRKKQPVLNAGVLSLLGSEKGREMGQPLLGTGEQIVGGEGIGEFLQGLRIGTLQESVRALLKADATLLHAQGQPVMLIETDASGEGKIGAHPYEHLSPTKRRAVCWCRKETRKERKKLEAAVGTT